MKSADKRKLQMFVDVLMIGILLLQMSYSIAGEMLHEITGMAFFVLFIIHHTLVIRYTKALFRGKRTPEKTVKILMDILLLIIVLLMILSAIPISKYIFTFIGLSRFASLGRTIHLLGAYWGFALINIHLGFHLDRILHKPMQKNKGLTVLVLTTIFIAGLIVFIKEGIYQYMFLINLFVYFDTNSGLLIFILKYILIAGMFAVVGYAGITLLKGKKKNEIIR